MSDNRKPRPSRPKRGRQSRNQKKQPKRAAQNYARDEKIRLNKYIAHCGFCSRRDADIYIEEGKVKVNGEKTTQMGVKVNRTDTVEVDGQTLSLEKFEYILLNKPKDTITTTDDPRNRDTVMDKIEDATGKRVYPVGRLDRHTMGLLLLTNDGDLAHRLMHPRYQVRKIYEVATKRALTEKDFRLMVDGIRLEDGMAAAHHVQSAPNGEFMITLMEGRNRMVRRMVEYFGTEVTRLKRIDYAGLNLEDVAMGRWRYLKPNEVNALRKLVKLKPLQFES